MQSFPTSSLQHISTQLWKPSLMIKIDYVLTNCVKVVVGKATREEDEVKEKAADNFH